jgi:hypothetical protein
MKSRTQDSHVLITFAGGKEELLYDDDYSVGIIKISFLNKLFDLKPLEDNPKEFVLKTNIKPNISSLFRQLLIDYCRNARTFDPTTPQGQTNLKERFTEKQSNSSRQKAHRYMIETILESPANLNKDEMPIVIYLLNSFGNIIENTELADLPTLFESFIAIGSKKFDHLIVRLTIGFLTYTELMPVCEVRDFIRRNYPELTTRSISILRSNEYLEPSEEFHDAVSKDTDSDDTDTKSSSKNVIKRRITKKVTKKAAATTAATEDATAATTATEDATATAAAATAATATATTTAPATKKKTTTKRKIKVDSDDDVAENATAVANKETQSQADAKSKPVKKTDPTEPLVPMVTKKPTTFTNYNRFEPDMIATEPLHARRDMQRIVPVGNGIITPEDFVDDDDNDSRGSGGSRSGGSDNDL